MSAPITPGPPPQPDHTPVLPREVLGTLAPRPGQVYVDATAGLGGHAAAIATHLTPGGRIILNDVDPSNLARAQAHVAAAVGLASLESGAVGDSALSVETSLGNFAQLPHALAQRGIHADLLLADLGFSTNQITSAERGFSFSREGPLDMRLDPSLKTSAADLVNSLPESELARLIADLGEDRLARQIARKLVLERKSGPILTTAHLADVVRAAYPAQLRHSSSIDPATRTFQALRIAVNDELGSLDALLSALERRPSAFLAPHARVAIITFHSLEDRPVKHAFERIVKSGLAAHLTPSPLSPQDDEREANPKSRSAKLRALQFHLPPR